MYATWEQIDQPGARFIGRDGEEIVLVSRGRRNLGSGPDFRDAVVLIDGELKVGPVEMHRNESEWYQHQHHHDDAYRDVIMHVVGSYAESIPRRTNLPTILLEKRPISVDLEPSTISMRVTQRYDVAALLTRYSWDRFINRVVDHLSGTSAPLSRQALLPCIYDALGYSENREAMHATASALVRADLPRTPQELFVQTVRYARFTPSRSSALLRRFVRNGQIGLESNNEQWMPRPWTFNTRPANRPEARIVGGATLDYRFFFQQGLSTLVAEIGSGCSIARLRESLVVRSGHFSFVGRDRAGLILVNVLLPAIAADAIHRSDWRVLESTLTLYRNFPPLSSNRKLRELSDRFFQGRRFRTSFEQQGALQFFKVSGSRALNRRKSLSLAEDAVANREESHSLSAESSLRYGTITG